jgi:hypothetical protein
MTSLVIVLYFHYPLCLSSGSSLSPTHAHTQHSKCCTIAAKTTMHYCDSHSLHQKQRTINTSLISTSTTRVKINQKPRSRTHPSFTICPESFPLSQFPGVMTARPA